MQKPQLKVDKKLCVIGNFNDINVQNIDNFLTYKSFKNIEHIIKDDYMNYNLWMVMNFIF